MAAEQNGHNSIQSHPVGKSEHGENHFGAPAIACHMFKLSGFNRSYNTRPFRRCPGHSAPPDSGSKEDQNVISSERNGSWDLDYAKARRKDDDWHFVTEPQYPRVVAWMDTGVT